MNEKLIAVAVRIVTLEKSVDLNKIEIDNQKDEIIELKKENNELSLRIDVFYQKLDNLVPDEINLDSSNVASRVHEIEERLESRTNRQLRQTLILRGIQELRDETWDDTKQLVAKAISKNTEVSYKCAENMINRVHRGKQNPRNHNQPRPIYMALHKWEDSEYIVEAFRDLNINKKSSIRAEYMFGPLTTIRRNAALLKRKELKEAGLIVSGYIQFPARLMTKKAGARRDEKYELFKDFSYEKVELKPRNPRSVDLGSSAGH